MNVAATAAALMVRRSRKQAEHLFDLPGPHLFSFADKGYSDSFTFNLKMRFPSLYRCSVGSVILLPFDERLHMDRRDQSHVVLETLGIPA